MAYCKLITGTQFIDIAYHPSLIDTFKELVQFT